MSDSTEFVNSNVDTPNVDTYTTTKTKVKKKKKKKKSNPDIQSPPEYATMYQNYTLGESTQQSAQSPVRNEMSGQMISIQQQMMQLQQQNAALQTLAMVNAGNFQTTAAQPIIVNNNNNNNNNNNGLAGVVMVHKSHHYGSHLTPFMIGLCACCDAPGTFCATMAGCIFWVTADNMSQISDGTESLCSAAMRLYCCGEDGGCAGQRTYQRKLMRIQGSRWNDCAAMVFCRPCALTQMSQEIVKRKQIGYRYLFALDHRVGCKCDRCNGAAPAHVTMDNPMYANNMLISMSGGGTIG